MSDYIHYNQYHFTYQQLKYWLIYLLFWNNMLIAFYLSKISLFYIFAVIIKYTIQNYAQINMN